MTSLRLIRLALLAERPAVRSECALVPRPCPWATCRHSTRVTVNRDGRTRSSPRPEHLGTGCVLDDAEDDSKDRTCEEIGRRLGMSRKNVADALVSAMEKAERMLAPLREASEESP